MAFYIYLLFCILLLIFTFVFALYVLQYAVTLFYGAPYVKSSDKRTKQIIKLLHPKVGEKIIDLGSGNGKLLFEIAKSGAIAYGIEINPFLVYLTKRQIKINKNLPNIFVKRGNLFNENLSKYDAIVIYGITYLMPKLEKKLLKELKPGTRVVSNYFAFPTLTAVKKEGQIRLYQI